MRLIIGLGNPGKQYASTRHNAGFLALDFLREHFDFESFHRETRFHAELSIGTIGQEKYLLIKPTTFMNRSGSTVRALLDFYKLSAQDIIVLHDDLDIAPGTHKTTLSSRAAGHNGVQDIIDMLGTQDFFRIRLGIGRPTETEGVCRPAHDYVLDPFSPDELALLQKIFPTLPKLITEPL
ncbi:MAG: aminoacyl-tRNA hydrolase [Candidatus Moranbacteria bacterium]|nr:aminoacyl-tRNA hydrolase [Candidatus Moranbacteria bacterium]MBP7695947.1 aminoacyl-tRNA hydrolase [Candidatus Moranbacteria bacterium]